MKDYKGSWSRRTSGKDKQHPETFCFHKKEGNASYYLHFAKHSLSRNCNHNRNGVSLADGKRRSTQDGGVKAFVQPCTKSTLRPCRAWEMTQKCQCCINVQTLLAAQYHLETTTKALLVDPGATKQRGQRIESNFVKRWATTETRVEYCGARHQNMIRRQPGTSGGHNTTTLRDYTLQEQQRWRLSDPRWDSHFDAVIYLTHFLGCVDRSRPEKWMTST